MRLLGLSKPAYTFHIEGRSDRQTDRAEETGGELETSKDSEAERETNEGLETEADDENSDDLDEETR